MDINPSESNDDDTQEMFDEEEISSDEGEELMPNLADVVARLRVQQHTEQSGIFVFR